MKITTVEDIPETKNNNMISIGAATVAYGKARSSGSSHQEALAQAKTARLKVSLERSQ